MSSRRFPCTRRPPVVGTGGLAAARLRTGRLAACIFAVLLRASAASADWSLEDQLVAAREACGVAIAKAEQTLLTAFDTGEELIRKSNRKPEEKQQSLDLLRQEKADFEQHGWYPWSVRMRPPLANFIRDRSSAEKTLAAVFDKATDAHVRARRDADAAAVLKLKKETLAPKLVARWEITGVTWKGSWTGNLYSNGHYSDPYGKALWTFSKGVLLLTQPEPGLPRGMKVLKWSLKESGTELDEIGNNGSTSTGKLINTAGQK